ncbi:MAG: TraR/DksA family transcriptional regulator [Bacteroidetes bacterium]|nr:TraR/DksA family transcriptional regulator [Bacteroidota bacterium]MBS1649385.1 TraR/DksA family transcriptional regulator [Bacteroidota bacterium]
MATKKPASKKVAKPAAKKSAAKPAPKKVAKPAAKKPAAKPASKKVAKPAVKKPAAKPASKKVAKPAAKKPAAKPAPKKAVKPVVKKPEPAKTPKAADKIKAVEIAKPVKPAKAEKPAKPAKPVKPIKPLKPVSKGIKVSGIEKATTVIPMKQLPVKKKEEPVKEVKIPKISIKTSVPYTPGYVPMEKREAEKRQNGEPIVRYNDSDLNEFRDLINKKLDAAKRELAYLQGLITRKDEMGGDESEGRYMTMEDGSMSMEREQLSQMASRQITYIDHLEKAIMRIENKTYGICRVTGKLIDKARLRAVPHATLSLEAKLGLVKPNSGE